MTTKVVAKPKAETSRAAKAKNGRKTKAVRKTQVCTSAADRLGGDQHEHAPHSMVVSANLSPLAVAAPSTNGQAPGDNHQRASQSTNSTNRTRAVSSADQSGSGAQTGCVGGRLSADHTEHESHFANAAAELLFCAEYLDDVERVRIATENRLRAMDEAGVEASIYEDQVIAFVKLEREATLALQRVVRRHLLGPWIKATKGIGEKQGARLLAAIGDVSYNHAEDRVRRGPAELWAYCGFVPGQKRQKGVKSNWNATAKMRAFLIAESCIKQMDSPYRAVYDRARKSWADRDVKDGHKHNHALRLVAKAVLKDLFLQARRIGA